MTHIIWVTHLPQSLHTDLGPDQQSQATCHYSAMTRLSPPNLAHICPGWPVGCRHSAMTHPDPPQPGGRLSSVASGLLLLSHDSPWPAPAWRPPHPEWPAGCRLRLHPGPGPPASPGGARVQGTGNLDQRVQGTGNLDQRVQGTGNLDQWVQGGSNSIILAIVTRVSAAPDRAGTTQP